MAKGRGGQVSLRLLLMYDGCLPEEAVAERLAAAHRAGVEGFGALLMMDPGWPGHRLLAVALSLREITREHGFRLLLDDRVDVALAAAADGVFLGRGALPPTAVRRILPRLPRRDFLIGRPACTVEEAALARLEEADYVLFHPVWPEPGLQALRAVVASMAGVVPGGGVPGGGLPGGGVPRGGVIAGGGVTPDRVEALVEAGVQGLAIPLEDMDGYDLATMVAAITDRFRT